MNKCAHPDCDKTLGPKNASGLCRTHFNQQPVSDETRAKRRATTLAMLAANPDLRERRRAAAAEAARRPDVRAARSARAKASRLWEHSIGKMTREQLDARNRAVSAARLAHIPSDYREEYRRLVKRKGFSAAEAEAMIITQYEADKARWRQEWAA